MNHRNLTTVFLIGGFFILGFIFSFTLVSIFPAKFIFSISPEIVNNEPHPYGNPFSGVLPWENDRKFHEFCAQNNISTRMGAFQTTLPDPLPGEEYNVALAADRLAGTLLVQGEIFSMNLRLGPYNASRGFREGPTYIGGQVTKTIGGGVCKIASTLYNVATLANLQIIERHPHGMPVPYVPPGQDATVYDGCKDFKFRNNTGEPIFLWADTRDNTLWIAVYGRVNPPRVSWHHQILNKVPTYTIHIYNKALKPVEKKVIIPGADGLAVRSWLTIEYKDGGIETRRLGVSYYSPLPEVVEQGYSN